MRIFSLFIFLSLIPCALQADRAAISVMAASAQNFDGAPRLKIGLDNVGMTSAFGGLLGGASFLAFQNRITLHSKLIVQQSRQTRFAERTTAFEEYSRDLKDGAPSRSKIDYDLNRYRRLRDVAAGKVQKLHRQLLEHEKNWPGRFAWAALRGAILFGAASGIPAFFGSNLSAEARMGMGITVAALLNFAWQHYLGQKFKTPFSAFSLGLAAGGGLLASSSAEGLAVLSQSRANKK